MSKTARTLLGVLIALGVAGATLALLVTNSQPEPTEPSPAIPSRPDPAPLEVPPPDPVEEPAEEPQEEQPTLEPVDERPAVRKVATHRPRPLDKPSPATDPEPEPAPPADTQPPKLAVLTPRGHAMVMTPKLLLRVKSEKGAQVAVDDKPLAENSPGLFAINLRLDKGRNDLTVTAQDEAGNQSVAKVSATYIDPARFERNKASLVSLLEQLDEVRSSAAELDRRISELVSRLHDPAHADKVSSLSRELRQIRMTRDQIEEEVGRAIQEIDTLLASSQ